VLARAESLGPPATRVRVERATGVEPATSSLGTYFDPLKKSLAGRRSPLSRKGLAHFGLSLDFTGFQPVSARNRD
jgi:hypothetical protein